MRRFIISAVAGLAVCLGGAAASQAAVVKSVTVTKTTVTTEHVVAPERVVRIVPERVRHVEVVHFDHRFEHGRHR
jgi:ABC-type glycerol-3-phosphate transport system substrate-binding protein